VGLHLRERVTRLAGGSRGRIEDYGENFSLLRRPAVQRVKFTGDASGPSKRPSSTLYLIKVAAVKGSPAGLFLKNHCPQQSLLYRNKLHVIFSRSL